MHNNGVDIVQLLGTLFMDGYYINCRFFAAFRRENFV